MLSSAPMALGSSPHTDWGTLTVMWQDDKGGLQTHCDACNVWSDVDASSSSLSNGVVGVVPDDGTTMTGGDDGDHNHVDAGFFVHVGNFLSLATMKVDMIPDDDNNGDGNIGISWGPEWPSPRHRVLCPHRVTNGVNILKGQLPSIVGVLCVSPPGISLDDVQGVMTPLLLSSPPPSSRPVPPNDGGDCESNGEGTQRLVHHPKFALCFGTKSIHSKQCQGALLQSILCCGGSISWQLMILNTTVLMQWVKWTKRNIKSDQSYL